MVLRVEKGKTLLRALQQKLPHLNAGVQFGFIKHGCWNVQAGTIQTSIWPQLCDERQKFLIQSEPSSVVAKNLKLSYCFLTKQMGIVHCKCASSLLTM